VEKAERVEYVDQTYSQLRKDWRACIFATTADDFESAWVELCENWTESNHELVQYLQKQWIPLRQRFCHAWTDKIMHMGNQYTSRVEGLNRTIKKELPHRMFHIREVVRVFTAFIERVHERNKMQLALEGQRRELVYQRDTVFTGLHGIVSLYAMKKVMEHVAILAKFHDVTPAQIRSECTHTFATIWGVPCGHAYSDKKAAGQSFQVTDFHIHWRLDRLKNLPPIDPVSLYKDPIKVQSRYVTGNTDTRVPSQFELVRADNTLPSQPTPRNPAQKRQRTSKGKAKATHSTAELSESSSSRPTASAVDAFEFGEASEVYNFRNAAKFVDWIYYDEQPPQWLSDARNEFAFCPDPLSARDQLEEEQNRVQHDLFVQEDDLFEPFNPASVVAAECRELRMFAAESYAKRHYGIPELWAPSKGADKDRFIIRQLDLEDTADKLRRSRGLPPLNPPDAEFEYPLLPSLEKRIRAERQRQQAPQDVVATFAKAVQAVANTLRPQEEQEEQEEEDPIIVAVMPVEQGEQGERRSGRGYIPRKRRYGDE
jgi:hypothetical protein